MNTRSAREDAMLSPVQLLSNWREHLPSSRVTSNVTGELKGFDYKECECFWFHFYTKVRYYIYWLGFKLCTLYSANSPPHPRTPHSGIGGQRLITNVCFAILLCAFVGCYEFRSQLNVSREMETTSEISILNVFNLVKYSHCDFAFLVFSNVHSLKTQICLR